MAARRQRRWFLTRTSFPTRIGSSRAGVGPFSGVRRRSLRAGKTGCFERQASLRAPDFPLRAPQSHAPPCVLPIFGPHPSPPSLHLLAVIASAAAAARPPVRRGTSRLRDLVGHVTTL